MLFFSIPFFQFIHSNPNFSTSQFIGKKDGEKRYFEKGANEFMQHYYTIM
jgi:hypothetical protein